MNFKALVLPLIIITLSLAGCLSMPISTMYKMSQLSVLGINPNEIQVAIRTSELIEVQNGAAHISLTTKTDGLVENSLNNANLPAFDQKYKFQVQALTSSRDHLSSILMDGIDDDERITILKLSNKDGATMAEVLARVKNYKAKGAKVLGGIGIGTNSSCFKHIDKFDELEVDVFLQTDVNDGFMLFLEDIDIIKEAKKHNVEFKTINKCQAD